MVIVRHIASFLCRVLYLTKLSIHSPYDQIRRGKVEAEVAADAADAAEAAANAKRREEQAAAKAAAEAAGGLSAEADEA